MEGGRVYGGSCLFVCFCARVRLGYVDYVRVSISITVNLASAHPYGTTDVRRLLLAERSK